MHTRKSSLKGPYYQDSMHLLLESYIFCKVFGQYHLQQPQLTIVIFLVIVYLSEVTTPTTASSSYTFTIFPASKSIGQIKRQGLLNTRNNRGSTYKRVKTLRQTRNYGSN